MAVPKGRLLFACMICGGCVVVYPGTRTKKRNGGPVSCGQPMDIVRVLDDFEDDFEQFDKETKSYVSSRRNVTMKIPL